MKKANYLLRMIALMLALIMCISSLSACRKTVSITTSYIEVGADEYYDGEYSDENYIDVGADEYYDGEYSDENVGEDSDDDKNNNNKNNSNKGNGGGTSSTTTVSKVTAKDYAKPKGAYNYAKMSEGLKSYYDFRGTLSDDKRNVTVTHSGGPANLSGVVMDPEQSYVIRCTVKTSSADTMARIIFKGNDAWNHLYLSLSPYGVVIYDTEGGLIPDNPFVAAETRVAASKKKFDYKANTEYKVIILNKPGYASVWINGELYFENLDLNNGMAINDYYLLPNYKSTVKESRFINTSNILGFYYTALKDNNEETITFSKIDAYYTVAGMDKNFIDDGKDTDYKSTWKQQEFYLGAYIFSQYGHTTPETDGKVFSLLKGANINFVIPQSNEGRTESVISNLEKSGLKYLVSEDGVLNGATMINENRIKTLVNKYKNNPNCVGFYVTDEPGKNNIWKDRKLAQLVTKYAPDKATFSCLLPSYSPYSWTTDDYPYNKYVDAFVSKVKPSIIGNDYYPFQEHGINIQMGTSQYYKDMGYIRKSANKTGARFWQVVSAQQNWDTGDVGQMNSERLQIQANAAVAYGASAVIYFTAQSAFATSQIITGKVEPGKYYNTHKVANLRTLNAGRAIFGAESEAVYHSNISAAQASQYFVNSAPDGIISDSKILSTIKSSDKNGIIVGVLKKGNTHFVVAVNKNYSANCTATITLKSAKSVALLNNDTGAFGGAASTNTLSTNIIPGGIAVWQIN